MIFEQMAFSLGFFLLGAAVVWVFAPRVRAPITRTIHVPAHLPHQRVVNFAEQIVQEKETGAINEFCRLFEKEIRELCPPNEYAKLEIAVNSAGRLRVVFTDDKREFFDVTLRRYAELADYSWEGSYRISPAMSILERVAQGVSPVLYFHEMRKIVEKVLQSPRSGLRAA